MAGEDEKTDAPPQDAGEQTAQSGGSAAGSRSEGVFGNLPRSRPGARSPLRDARGGRRAAATRARAEESEQPSAPKPAEEPRDRRDESGPAPPPRSDGGLEDLAWAGIAAAAEAATIGVRLATKALEAVRGPREHP